MSRIALLALVLISAHRADSQIAADPPKDCEQCAAWNTPQRPFRIFGNTYYVGTTELSALLVAGNDGLVLLDGALPQSAPLIDASIRALGFATTDVRLIVSSHAHHDHVGGIAALQRASGAIVATSRAAAESLRAGQPSTDDPQHAVANNDFPAVPNVRLVADGETLTVGDVQITAHLTPGHTPGGTTWTWQSCDAARCVQIVYADSLNAVSADDFRFTGNAVTPSIVAQFERSIGVVEALPCDILLTPHPGFFAMRSKLERLTNGDAAAFIDATACRAYAGAARARLAQRVAEEQSRR